MEIAYPDSVAIKYGRWQNLNAKLQTVGLSNDEVRVLEEELADMAQMYSPSRPFAPRTSESINVSITSSLPTLASEGTLLAGMTHPYRVKIGNEAPNFAPDSIYAYLIFTFEARNLEDAIITPDRFRHSMIDTKGNSRPLDFLVTIPENYQGRSAIFEAGVFNGSVCIARMQDEVEIV